MWFVLEFETEITIAMCHFEDVAIEIANSFPARCVIRYNAANETGYAKDAKFFQKKIEKSA